MMALDDCRSPVPGIRAATIAGFDRPASDNCADFGRTRDRHGQVAMQTLVPQSWHLRARSAGSGASVKK
ncbi:MAG: hypothetical protein V4516_12770, partial [Pseudomonadota bacterium]